jgi:hypothetical protein
MAPKWQLVGTYFETCNCDVVCPWVFLSAPTTGECTVLVGWHIERGSFDHVPLDGLNVTLAVHAPGRMAQVKWKAALYVDATANEAQQQALTQIFTGQAGGHPARLVSHVGGCGAMPVGDVLVTYRYPSPFALGYRQSCPARAMLRAHAPYGRERPWAWLRCAGHRQRSSGRLACA